MTAGELAPLGVAIPLAGAALVGAVGAWVPGRVVGTIGTLTAACTAATCAALAAAVVRGGTVVHWFGGWTPVHGVALGIAFVVQPPGALLAAFAAFLTLAAFVYSSTFYDKAEPPFSILMLLFVAALVGFCLTGDLFNLFVFFELMSVAAYALTGYRTEDVTAVEGALNFAVINSVGAFFTLTGIALLYGRVGALNMAEIARTVGQAPGPLVTVAAVFIIVGFLVKSAIAPFHFWLSDAHAVAPTPLCVLFSGVMVQLGLYAVARVYYDVFGGSIAGTGDAVRSLLFGFGVGTALLGGIMAFAQRHLKRLLAFSTIAHSGIMLCAFALFAPLGLGGMWVYIVGHGFVKAGLFMLSGIVLNLFGTLDLEQLRERLRDRLWLPAGFAAGGLALAGLPPFGTLLGSSMIDGAARDGGFRWVGPVLLVAASLTGGAVLAMAGRLAFGWGPPPDRSGDSPQHEQTEEPNNGFPAVMFGCACAMLLCALGAGLFPHAADRAAEFSATFMRRPLHGHAPSLASAAPAGILSAALAVTFAAGALFGYRLPLLSRACTAIAKPPFALLRRIHSGKVTDDLAWLTAGTAALGAAFAALVAR